ncbi:MAG TPA: response regulator [Aggregatilineales bacterium]|nr:response regulator [Anaerolineales bacterium]HRE46916.1 response regulator [Aggregatilineales bacterium]
MVVLADFRKGAAMPKLLIVDDEPMTVEMLETFLQISGFQTVGALSGEDGLTLLQAEQPELLILDLMLPDIEGFEICRRIRTLPEYAALANLPVLIISARVDSVSKQRARDAGADGYLTKPVRLQDLSNELSRLLNKPRTPPDGDGGTLPSTPPAPAAPTAPIPPIPPTGDYSAAPLN